jgi:hypothetical protein
MRREISVAFIVACSLHAHGQTQQLPQCPVSIKFEEKSNSTFFIDCHGDVVSRTAVHAPLKAVTSETTGQVSQNSELAANSIDPRVAKSFNDFAIWQNEYTKRVFDHQDTYTFFIFMTVNLLVLAGLYFAWLQFKATLHLSQRSRRSRTVTKSGITESPEGKSEPNSSGPWEVQELKVGPDGLAISSSFVGLIILGLSMCFFFMYLKYVYPINITGTPTIQRSADPSTDLEKKTVAGGAP